MNSVYSNNGVIGPFSQTPQVVIPQITVPAAGSQRWEPLTCRGKDTAYKMYTPPGVRVPIFDEEEQVFYFKETDNYGNIVTFETYGYNKIEDPPPPEYVTVSDFNTFLEDFNKLKEELLNAKSVRSQEHNRSYNNSKDEFHTTNSDSK